MSYTYHGTSNIIELPGRSVQTYPSGLVRVERSFVCRRGQEANFRSRFAQGKQMPLDDGKPAIDGLYIFPDPQETARDDGFVEFRVTAYGRTNLVGAYTRQGFAFTLEVSFSTSSFGSPVQNFTKNLGEGVGTKAIHRFCAPAVEAVRYVPADGVLSLAIGDTPIQNFAIIPVEFDFPDLSGYHTYSRKTNGRPTASDQKFYVSQSFRVRDIQRTNFGFWDEYTVDYAPFLEGSFLGLFIPIQEIQPEPELEEAYISSILSFFGYVSITFNFPNGADSAVLSGSGLPTISLTPGFSGTGENYLVNSSFGGKTEIIITGLDSLAFYSGNIVFSNQFTNLTVPFSFRTKGK